MLIPKSEQELAEMVATSTGSLCILGGGTRGIVDDLSGQKITTEALNGINLYDPGALTLVVGAGTPISDIQSTLASEGQYLPFEPVDYRGMMQRKGIPTIGGAFASNNSGPRRIQCGAARDFLLGVRFVDGNGNIIKNGGRVMKNVTGYDLVKLMCGSFGTLGIISEVAMKVLPAPKTCATVIVCGLSDENAVKAMSAALKSPYDVSAAAHQPNGQNEQPVTMIRLEGFAESVDYRARKIMALLANFGDGRIETENGRNTHLWQQIRDASAFENCAGDVWRISVRPSVGPAMAAKLEALQIVYDWGGGLIWALVPETYDVRAQLGDFDGHATLVRGTPKTQNNRSRFQPEPAPIARLSQGLRNKFDARGIFNSGLMAGAN